jgi:hypothetical protein
VNPIYFAPDDDVEVDSDEPGDNTIRPCRPERRAILEKVRELLRRWGIPRKPKDAS